MGRCGLLGVALYTAVDRPRLSLMIYCSGLPRTAVQALRKRVNLENKMARNGSVRPMASTAIISAPSSL